MSSHWTAIAPYKKYKWQNTHENIKKVTILFYGHIFEEWLLLVLININGEKQVMFPVTLLQIRLPSTLRLVSLD